MRVLTWTDAVEPIHLSVAGNRGRYTYPEHRHAGYWELLVVRRGRMTHLLNGVEHQQGPGGVTLVRDCDIHGMRGEGLEFVNLAMDQRFIAPLVALVLAPHGLAALDGRPPLIGILDSAARELVDRQLTALERAVDRPSLATAWMAVAGVVLHAILAPGRGGSGPDWLRAALERLADARSVVSLATFRAWCGVSDEHLARTVKTACGLTPHALLEGQRLQQAARALRASDRPVEAVARDAGFSSARLLARRFRIRYGVTPSAWRAQRLA